MLELVDTYFFLKAENYTLLLCLPGLQAHKDFSNGLIQHSCQYIFTIKTIKIDFHFQTDMGQTTKVLWNIA